MNINTFENQFNKTILKRGYDYYIQGHVDSLDQIDKTTWQAEVDGSSVYIVDIQINSKGEISFTNCDCPFNDDCKHIAAVLYTIQAQQISQTIFEQPKVKETAPQKQTLEQLLKAQTKEQLIALIQKVAKSHPNFKKELQLLLTPIDNIMVSAKQIIKHHLKMAQDRSGFIPWRESENAMHGIDIVHERIQEQFDDEAYMTALELSFLCFNFALEAIQYGDDSSGEFGARIDESLNLVAEAVSLGAEVWKKEQYEQAYALIIKEAQNPELDGWSDWQIEIMGTCINLCDDDEIEQQFLTFLQSLERSNNNNWSNEYFNKQLRELHFQLISFKSTDEELEKFLAQNLGDDNMRKRVIESALTQQDYEKVLQLATDGIQHDKAWPGLVSNWTRYVYTAHKGLGNVAQIKELSLQLVIGGDYEYYEDVKKLHAAEWPNALDKLLTDLNKKSSHLYAQIIVEEKQYKRILDYCKAQPMRIESYYPHIRELYYEDVCALFIEHIESSAARASDRKRYQDVCRTIKNMREAGYKIEASGLIVDLLQQYPKRRAFIDELQSIQ